MTTAGRRVLFVCRGSAADGMGHVIRARTVALAMQQRAEVKLAAVGGTYVRNLLESQDVDYELVSDPSELARVAEAFDPEVIVFDLLELPDAVFSALASDRLTASLSPIFNQLAHVDLLFHRTEVVDESWERFGAKPQVRKGLKYAVIGDHCHRIQPRTYRETLERKYLSVAVSMGGTDAANKTLRVIETLRDNRHRLLLWVLLGEGYEHSYQDLVEAARNAKHEIILAKTNESMWHILGTCALAILAGGTTTYQAAYAGLPSINGLERPEQLFLIRELVDRGAAICAGTDFETSLLGLNDAVEHLNEHRGELLDMHKRARRLLDSRGADRICDEVLAQADMRASE